MKVLGDFTPSKTIICRFNTHKADGTPITLAGTPAVSVYKNSTTESTTGVTLTVDYDSRTGLHHVAIDTSLDGTFYAAGNDFDIVITTGTVDGVSVVGTVVGTFSLSNRSALRPATADRTLVVDANGLADATCVKLGPSGTATAQTARDIGSSVLISSGTGTGQLSVTAGVVSANVTQISGSAVNTSTAQLGVNVVNFGGSAGTFSAGRPEVNTTHWGGTAVASANVRANVVQVAGQTASAAAGVTFPSSIGTATLTAADVWGVATRTLTSGTNIVLSKGVGVTGFNDLDAAGVRSAVGLASANLDTQLSTIAGYIDTEISTIISRIGVPVTSIASDIAAIQADTDNIQTRIPAALVSGRMDVSVGAYQTGLTPLQPTIAGRTLDVTATGGAGIDWSNVENPTSIVALTGTTISTAQTITSVSGSVGSVLGNVGGYVADVSNIVTSGAITTDAGLVYADIHSVAGSRDAGSGLYNISNAAIQGEPLGSVTDVTGKVLGGGVSTITGIGAWVAGASGNAVSTLDASGVRTAIGMSSANLDSQLDNIPTVNEFNARTILSADYATATNLAVVAGYLDTEIAAILEDTGTTLPAQIASLGFPSVESVASAVWANATRTLTSLSGLTIDTVTNVTNKVTADVTHFGGNAGIFYFGRPEVNTTRWGGALLKDVVINANTIELDGQSVIASTSVTFPTSIGTSVLTQSDIRSAVGLSSANLDTQLDNIPTVSEFYARSLLSGDYATATNLSAVLEDTSTTLPSQISSLSIPTSNDVATEVWNNTTRTLTSVDGLTIHADVDVDSIVQALSSLAIATGVSERLTTSGGTPITTLTLKQALQIILSATVGDKLGLGSRSMSTQIPGDSTLITAERTSQSTIRGTVVVGE